MANQENPQVAVAAVEAQPTNIIQRLFGMGGADRELAERIARAEGEALLLTQQRTAAEERARIERLQAEAAQRRRELTENAYFKLREAMIGKRLDNTWQAYASNIIRDYLDTNNELNPRNRVEVIEGAIKLYVQHLHSEEHLTVADILAMRSHNEHIRGEINTVRWWNPLTWHQQVQLSENSNGSSRVSMLYSGAQIALVGFGAATAALIGAYYTSRVFSSLTTGTTIPRITSLPSPPSQIDMTQLSSLSTTLSELPAAINTLKSLSDIQTSSPNSSTSTELVIVLSERCINALWRTLNRAVDIVREYSHSQR
uniref:Uncharacterized protein n=1 Tax=Xiangshan tombus-like virus TaxID=2886240 RepID=A0A8K1P3J1_9TOMB|nr:MAG: hypothetical protein [Xiangshan tombus-like virus]